MNLRELAESLGLSQTTVSRALNGYPEVREETRARVLAAAGRRQLHPQLAGRAVSPPVVP
jgi:LacI family transcriptional regulator